MNSGVPVLAVISQPSSQAHWQLAILRVRNKHVEEENKQVNALKTGIFEVIYQTRKIVIDHISKHREES